MTFYKNTLIYHRNGYDLISHTLHAFDTPGTSEPHEIVVDVKKSGDVIFLGTWILGMAAMFVYMAVTLVITPRGQSH